MGWSAVAMAGTSGLFDDGLVVSKCSALKTLRKSLWADIFVKKVMGRKGSARAAALYRVLSMKRMAWSCQRGSRSGARVFENLSRTFRVELACD